MKTELDKMLSGEIYDSCDREILKLSRKAQRLLGKFNRTAIHKERRKRHILDKLFGKTSGHVEVVRPFTCEYGFNIEAGENLFINTGCIFLDPGRITIGNDVSIGPGTQLLTATHPSNPEERLEMDDMAKPISIGNQVFIGGGVIICPGVTIGDGSTIGAGSVVTKDIPSHVLAVGNPCRVVKPLI